MPVATLPPFPDDVPTHPLLIIDFELIRNRDESEIERLWEASTKLGFWYLKNHGVDEEVNAMFDMGAETMDLPLEEKMKYEQGDGGMSHGYKAAGKNAVDASGNLDSVEYLNISKDDALSYPIPTHRTYPSTVNARMQSTITPFIKKSLFVNNTLIDVLNDKLGLEKGALLKLHGDEHSGSEARVIKKAPNPNWKDEQGLDLTQALGSHTDFGSLSFLHNRLGGLQVLVPGAESWQYVRPIPGHAICNVGDALSIFSGGILRSNMHRVVPPPKYQSLHTRWSLVFFTRPGNAVVLRALTDQSQLIKQAVENTKESERGKWNTGSTAGEWFARRTKYQRIGIRKGPESWMNSRGTESVQEA